MFSSHGYAKIWSPDNVAADNDGYVYEHVLQMQKKLGRALLSDEQVHHVNGLKDMNMIWNLQLMSIADHRRHHSNNQKSQLRDLSERHIISYIRLWRWLDPSIKTNRIGH